MKLVAGAKLKRAQEAVVAARPYSILMRQVIASVAATCEPEEHPLFRNHQPPRKILVIPMTSDRGLCGGFNSSILRHMDRFLESSKDTYDEIQLAAVGRRGRDYFRRRGRLGVIDTERIVEDLPPLDELVRRTLAWRRDVPRGSRRAWDRLQRRGRRSPSVPWVKR